MGYRIGFDIGSTTIKAVVLDENNQICYKSYERHKAQVRQKALDKLVELKKYTNPLNEDIARLERELKLITSEIKEKMSKEQ